MLVHVYYRLFTYKSGVMIRWLKINGVSLGDKLWQWDQSYIGISQDFSTKFTIDVFAHSGPTSPAKETLLEEAITLFIALSHTPEAVKFTRKCHFICIYHFGLNILFLNITPDDLCSFRVRLYVKAREFVSFLCQIFFKNCRQILIHSDWHGLLTWQHAPYINFSTSYQRLTTQKPIVLQISNYNKRPGWSILAHVHLNTKEL